MSLETVVESPVVFTDAAAKALRKHAEEPDAKDKLLRLSISGGGCSGFSYQLTFDTQRETDLRVAHNGVEYLIDPVSVRYLEGVTIDHVTGVKETGFKFNNPNARGTCGCGSSFNPY